jgi:hypothetical protein
MDTLGVAASDFLYLFSLVLSLLSFFQVALPGTPSLSRRVATAR